MWNDQCVVYTVNTLTAKDGDLRLSARNACLPKTEICVFLHPHVTNYICSHCMMCYAVRKKKCSQLVWYKAIIFWFSQFIMTVVQKQATLSKKRWPGTGSSPKTAGSQSVIAVPVHVDGACCWYSRTPDERPPSPTTIPPEYDHTSCDGQWFLFVYESLTSDHPSYTTTPMWFWGWFV